MQTLLIKLSVLLVKMKPGGGGSWTHGPGQRQITTQEILRWPWLLQVGSSLRWAEFFPSPSGDMDGRTGRGELAGGG